MDDNLSDDGGRTSDNCADFDAEISKYSIEIFYGLPKIKMFKVYL